MTLPSHDRLRRMATKPKDINWGELNALEKELVEWLEARNLVGPDDGELTLVLKLQTDPKRHGPVVSAVVQVIYEIELYRAAHSRISGENIIPKDAKLTEEERKAVLFVMDDSVERDAHRAIRGLRGTLSHIGRLVGQVAERHVERANVMRFAPDQKAIDARHELVLGFLAGLAVDARKLHQAFLLLSPSMRGEPLSLAGGEQFVKRLRSQLADAGYPGG